MATADKKLYYKIGEVSRQIEVPAHTIRYWEREFGPALKNRRNNRGHRIYAPTELKRLRQIKDLLYNQGYHIKAVKQILREEKRPAGRQEPAALPRKQLIAKLNKISRLLDRLDRI